MPNFSATFENDNCWPFIPEKICIAVSRYVIISNYYFWIIEVIGFRNYIYAIIKKYFCLLISTECITHAFKIADCGPLFDPDIYIHVSTPNGIIYNKIASYSCVTGYKLNGNATRKCSASGYWNGGEPSCTVIGRCITFTFVFIPA